MKKLKTKKTALKRFKYTHSFFCKRSGFNHLRRKKQNKTLNIFKKYKKIEKSNSHILKILMPK